MASYSSARQKGEALTGVCLTIIMISNMLRFSRRLNIRSSSEAIVAEIEEMVLKGELKPGDRLPNEAELASLFKVSRGSLREALSALKAKGIIERRPGKGTYIRQINRSELLGLLATCKRDEELFIDLLEVRELVESKVIELAIERATDEDLGRIEAALKRFPTKISENSLSVLDADLEFHLALALASHNEILFYLARTVNELLKDVREQTLLYPGRLQECQAEHKAIYDAIRARDSERALYALKQHLGKVKKEVIKREKSNSNVEKLEEKEVRNA